MMTLDEFLAEWNSPDDRMLVHTSGSTGKPKPLWVEKHRMEASARITCHFLGLKAGDTALLCMPLDYIAGKMMVVRALTCGLRLSSVEPSSHPLASTSPREPLTLVAMVPLQVWNTLQVPQERERLMQVKHLLIGGGAVSHELETQLQPLPNAVWSTYGMTETLSHIALRRLNGPERSDYYTPFEGIKVALDNEGCLVIDAPAVHPGRLATNDRAILAPDGRRFKIIGRKDNVVCSGGIKLQIEEIEEKLRSSITLPFIISKRPDPLLGETVVLLVEGNDTEKWREACRKALSKYEMPRHIVCVDRLPLTDTGKPARKQAERLASKAQE